MDKRMNDNLMENYEQEKSFGELDLVDDYMFGVVTENLESVNNRCIDLIRAKPQNLYCG